MQNLFFPLGVIGRGGSHVTRGSPLPWLPQNLPRNKPERLVVMPPGPLSLVSLGSGVTRWTTGRNWLTGSSCPAKKTGFFLDTEHFYKRPFPSPCEVPLWVFVFKSFCHITRNTLTCLTFCLVLFFTFSENAMIGDHNYFHAPIGALVLFYSGMR